MPVFTYKALNVGGVSEGGIVDADTPKEARLKLKGRKLHVTDLSVLEEVSGGPKRRPVSRIRIFRTRRREDVAIITRQLATLLGSGIPMIGALTAIIEQAEHAPLKATMMDVRERVSQGGTLSEAMAVHSFYFSDLTINMVRAGEAGGNLDTVLFRVADYLHAQNRTRAKVVAALTYPIIMLVIGTLVVFVLLTLVVPKILDVIQSQDAVLPLPTVILIGVSNFFGKYWWAMLAVLAGCWFLYWRAYATEAGRLWIDTAKLRIPVLGTLIKKAAISRFAITFATLLESGLPVLEAMGVVRRVVDNALLADTLEKVRVKVAEGADISTPLKNSKVFPPVVGYMIAVGEESGRLEELLKKTAQAYDEEVEVASQKLTSLLEPLMIVLMAGLVGFIVMAVMLPIIQMSNL